MQRELLHASLLSLCGHFGISNPKFKHDQSLLSISYSSTLAAIVVIGTMSLKVEQFFIFTIDGDKGFQSY
jgi:hypothetical protein